MRTRGTLLEASRLHILTLVLRRGSKKQLAKPTDSTSVGTLSASSPPCIWEDAHTGKKSGTGYRRNVTRSDSAGSPTSQVGRPALPRLNTYDSHPYTTDYPNLAYYYSLRFGVENNRRKRFRSVLDKSVFQAKVIRRKAGWAVKPVANRQ